MSKGEQYTLASLRIYADALYCRAWASSKGSLPDLEALVALVDEVVELRQRVAMMEMEAGQTGLIKEA